MRPRLCHQPGGLPESSRWSQRSADHRKGSPKSPAPRRGARFTILFIPAGLGIGLGDGRFGRPLVYAVTGFGLSRSSKIHNRALQTVVFLPFFLLYMILPVAMACGGLVGVWTGSAWLVRHWL